MSARLERVAAAIQTMAAEKAKKYRLDLEREFLMPTTAPYRCMNYWADSHLLSKKLRSLIFIFDSLWD